MDNLVHGSLEGNTDAIYVSIGENPNVLVDIDREPFAITPMHRAAENGHTHFVVEMMILKPSFARKLNQGGFSPIHLALQNRHSEVAIRMVEMDRELVRVKGRDGVTPLHYVAEHGDPQLLKVLVSACPTSLQDVTSRNQTALHVAVKNRLNPVECVQVILETYQKFPQSGKYLNLKDSNGDTPLHVATSTGQNMVVIMLQNAVSTTSYTSESMLESFLSAEERLKSAAEKGDINFLYYLIKDDPHILDRIDAIPFVDTPLHIAASLGHIQFAMEVMKLKPSFSTKLNPEGFNPLHLALHNERIDMAYRLVEADSELVRTQGKHGETALHFAVRHGYQMLLDQFLTACPLSILDVTMKRETVLHIALRNSKYNCFRFLIGKLRTSVHKGSDVQEMEILNKQDENLETVLHVAVKTNQPQVVNLLLDCGVEKNLANSEGLTPLSVLPETPEDAFSRNAIERMLLKAKASRALPNTSTLFTIEAKIPVVPRWMIFISRSRSNMSEDLRSMLLVVAVLIVTAGYQVVLTPPSGLWQDNNYNDVTSSNNTQVNITTTSSTSVNKSLSHRAGTTIMPFQEFILFEFANSTAIFIAIIIISFLLPGGPITWALLYSLATLFYCYMSGMMIVAGWTTASASLHIFGYTFLLFSILLGIDRLDRRLGFKSSIRKNKRNRN